MINDKQVNNRQRKKSEATIHNQTMDIATHIFPLGLCDCQEGDLFMYLKSEDQNIFNIYCTKCEIVKSFKNIDEYKDIKLMYPPSAILRTLTDNYGEKKMEALNE